MFRFIVLFCALVCIRAYSSEKIIVQLKWKHQFQFAGHYAAIEKGYYKARGLDVELRELKEGADPVHEVAGGDAQFGIGSSELLLNRMNGAPIVVLATIFQHSPYALMAKANSGITTVQDLVGKRVMIETQSAEVLAYLKNEGVPLEKLKLVPHTFNTSDLLQGNVAAMTVYLTEEPYALKEKKIPFVLFMPSSGGIDFFGDHLFTTENLLKTRPDIVRAFVEATLMGWEYAFKNPDEIIHLIYEKYSKRLTKAQLKYEAEKMRGLIRPDLIELGHINAGRWKHVAKVYYGLGMLNKNPEESDWDSFLYDPHQNRLSKILVFLLGVSALVAAVFSIMFLPFYFINKKLKKEMVEKERFQKQLEENERKFRLLVQNSHDIIAIVDSEGRSFYISDSLEKVTGYKVEEILNHSIVTYMHPDDAGAARKAFENVLSHPHAALFLEFRYRKKEGGWGFIEVTGTNLLHDPSIQGVVLNLRDVTERKQNEEEKEKMRRQLYHTEKLASIGTLAAGIAHEINNPLTIIEGYFEMIQSEHLNTSCNRACAGKMEKYVQKQKSAVQRISNIVNGLRLSSKPESQEFLSVDFHELIEETLSMIGPLFEKANIEIKLELSALQSYIFANRGKIQQVLVNLFVNARDALKDSKNPRVLIKTKNENGKFVFVFEDNGCGIAKENLEKIFMPFYTSKEPDKGTGLGLYIVHSIVQEAKGMIHVESELGEGTSFIIEFPSYISSLQESLKSSTVNVRGTEIPARALIVEDENEILFFLKKVLEDHGMQVELASNGQEAMNKLLHAPFDHVFTDITMPVMDGNSFLLEAIRLALKGTRFYVITGNIETDQVKLIDDSVRDFIYDYIQKPFTSEDIVQALIKEK